MTTNFYSGLQERQQLAFEKIFEDHQIEEILEFNENAGYLTYETRRVCEALNYIKPRQRRQFFEDLKN